MTMQHWLKPIAGLAMVGALALAGCETQPRGGGSDDLNTRWNSDAWVDNSARTQQPAPQPAPAPAKKEEPRRIFGGCGSYSPPVAPGMTVSQMAFPTGSTSTSAIVVHQVMPREVRLGKNYDYELHVSNLTEGTLQNVIVMLEDTANQTIVSSVPASSKGSGGGTQWLIGDLDGCKTQVIRVTAKADKGGTSSNCISVSYNNAMCAATNVVEPALAITKSAPAEAMLCDNIVMKLEVKNTGSATLTNVRVKDNLPSGMTTVDNQANVDKVIGTLNPGQAMLVTINAKAAKTGSYENAATATADGDITANSNKTVTVVKQPTLTIEAKCGGNILIGRNSNCTFIVKNTGNAVAANTMVTANVPAGTSFVSADMGGKAAGNKVSWNVGNLNPGESKTVMMTVKSSGAGEIRCEASASAVCASQVSANCSSKVEGTPDIGTSVDDDDGVVLVGDPHVYNLTVMNQGQVNLTNVKMTLKLADSLMYVSATQAPGKTDGKLLTFDFGNMAPGARKTIKVTVKADKAGDVLVIGETTSDQTKFPVRDDEYTSFVAP